ncbi:MAG: hypothetical protein M1835_003182 [Candelina submexicana]|nr:MAG: hypothetical protein M1835_003182 [Candelina submexicana]
MDRDPTCNVPHYLIYCASSHLTAHQLGGLALEAHNKQLYTELQTRLTELQAREAEAQAEANKWGKELEKVKKENAEKLAIEEKKFKAGKAKLMLDLREKYINSSVEEQAKFLAGGGGGIMGDMGMEVGENKKVEGKGEPKRRKSRFFEEGIEHLPEEHVADVEAQMNEEKSGKKVVVAAQQATVEDESEVDEEYDEEATAVRVKSLLERVEEEKKGFEVHADAIKSAITGVKTRITRRLKAKETKEMYERAQARIASEIEEIEDMSPEQWKAEKAKMLLEMREKLMSEPPEIQEMMLKDIGAVVKRFDGKTQAEQARNARRVRFEESKAEKAAEVASKQNAKIEAKKKMQEAKASAKNDGKEEGSAATKAKSRKGHRGGKKAKKAAINKAANELIAEIGEADKELIVMKAEIETPADAKAQSMLRELNKTKEELQTAQADFEITKQKVIDRINGLA